MITSQSINTNSPKKVINEEAKMRFRVQIRLQAIGHPAESVNDEQNPDYPVDISRSANQVAQQNEMDSENDEAD